MPVQLSNPSRIESAEGCPFLQPAFRAANQRRIFVFEGSTCVHFCVVLLHVAVLVPRGLTELHRPGAAQMSLGLRSSDGHTAKVMREVSHAVA